MFIISYQHQHVFPECRVTETSAAALAIDPELPGFVGSFLGLITRFSWMGPTDAPVAAEWRQGLPVEVCPDHASRLYTPITMRLCGNATAGGGILGLKDLSVPSGSRRRRPTRRW